MGSLWSQLLQSNRFTYNITEIKGKDGPSFINEKDKYKRGLIKRNANVMSC